MILKLVLLCATTAVALGKPLTYETTPLGTAESPLILRTYCPDPGLDPAILPNHGKGARSPKYNARKGQDVNGEYKPIKGIPAAIAVSHGPALSYVFDTVECRVLYAWQGGFLDLFPYWGSAKQGSRRSFDYLPRLVGTVFFLATGPHPLGAGEPRFQGYELDANGVPTFLFQIGEQHYRQTIKPGMTPLSFQQRLDAPAGEGRPGTSGLRLIKGKEISKHTGFERDLKIKVASAAAGEDVFNAYGCIACHTTDGGQGHGPTLFRLADSKRLLSDGEAVLANENYLRESIVNPNAQIAQGFPPNYMPPIPLKTIEVDSLVLYIQSLKGE